MKISCYLALLVVCLTGCGTLYYNHSSQNRGQITVVNGVDDVFLEVREGNISYGFIGPGENLTINTDFVSCYGPYLTKNIYVTARNSIGFKGAAYRTFTIKNPYYQYNYVNSTYYYHPPCESYIWIIRRYEIR